MAQLPADRSKLALAQDNQTPTKVASSSRNINAMTEAYDTIDALYYFTVGLVANGTLMSGAINPDSFTGNDFQKVQAAINAAIVNNTAVVLYRSFNITSYGPLSIIKPYPYLGTFRIICLGGAIVKNDAGFIFQNPALTPRMSDFDTMFMRYESNDPATVTKVWDCDYFLRINDNLSTYIGIDNIIRSDAVLAQSIRISHARIRKGNGYAINCFSMIDCSFSNCLVEDRNSGWGYSGGFIANTGVSNLVSGGISNYNIRIENNVVEGMELAAFKLGTCMSSVFSGNYLESNGSYFDLVSYVSASNFHNAITFSGNHIQQTTAQAAANVPGLDITNILGHNNTDYKQQSNTLFSGNRALGLLYKVTGSYYINSIGDYAAGALCSPMTQIILPAGLNFLPVNSGVGALATVKSGIISNFKHTSTVNLTANERKILVFTVTNAYFASPMTENTIMSPRVSDPTNVRVDSWDWTFTSGNVATVTMAVVNLTAGPLSFFLKLQVSNPGD